MVGNNSGRVYRYKCMGHIRIIAYNNHPAVRCPRVEAPRSAWDKCHSKKERGRGIACSNHPAVRCPRVKAPRSAWDRCHSKKEKGSKTQ